MVALHRTPVSTVVPLSDLSASFPTPNSPLLPSNDQSWVNADPAAPQSATLPSAFVTNDLSTAGISGRAVLRERGP